MIGLSIFHLKFVMLTAVKTAIAYACLPNVYYTCPLVMTGFKSSKSLRALLGVPVFTNFLYFLLFVATSCAASSMVLTAAGTKHKQNISLGLPKYFQNTLESHNCLGAKM